MTNSTATSNREQLEKLWIQQIQKPKLADRIQSKINQIFQQLIRGLITGDQPRVWRSSQQGKNTWNAYDPVSRCQVEGLSESEMRGWLEQRYNR